MKCVLLYIRWRQLNSYFNAAGPALPLVLGLIWLLIYISYNFYSSTDSALYLTLFLFIICLGIQLNRNDKAFVYLNLKNPIVEFYSEYFVLTLPFSAPAIFTDNFWCFPLLYFLLLLVPLLKFSLYKKAHFKKISGIIPAKNFEFLTGIRKTGIYIIPLYLFALLFSWVQVLPLFILWLITQIVCSFFTECEPQHLLHANYSTAKELLVNKLKKNSLFLTVLYLPIVLIHLLTHSDLWLVSLLWLPVLIINLCCAICLKYSLYTPNYSLTGNNAKLVVVAFIALIPFLLPIGAIMLYDYFVNAEKNLKPYFNDQN